MGHQWEESLFGCMANIPVCLITCLIPGGMCVIQATAVDHATHEGKAVPCILIYCLLQIGGAINRESIRKKFEIDGSLAGSLVYWCCCPMCSACQEYREVSSRCRHRE